MVVPLRPREKVPAELPGRFCGSKTQRCPCKNPWIPERPWPQPVEQGQDVHGNNYGMCPTRPLSGPRRTDSCVAAPWREHVPWDVPYTRATWPPQREAWPLLSLAWEMVFLWRPDPGMALTLALMASQDWRGWTQEMTGLLRTTLSGWRP